MSNNRSSNNSAKSSFDLASIYTNTLAAKHLIAFTKAEYTDENITFLLKAKTLQNKDNCTTTEIDALYKEFKDTLNLSSTNKQKFAKDSIASKKDALNSAVREITGLVSSDIMPRFLRSKNFKNYLEESKFEVSSASPMTFSYNERVNNNNGIIQELSSTTPKSVIPTTPLEFQVDNNWEEPPQTRSRSGNSESENLDPNITIEGRSRSNATITPPKNRPRGG